MAFWLPLLASGLLLQGSVREPPEQIFELARAAHAGDSAAQVAAQWEDRVRRDPADRAARLGLATLANLRYDVSAASREYAVLLDPGTAADQYTAVAYAGLALLTLGREPFDSTRSLARLGERVADRLADSLGLVENRVLLGFVASRNEGTAPALAHFARAAAAVPRDNERLQALVACYRAPTLSFGGVGDPVTEVRRGLDHARASGDLRTIGFCHQTALTVSINASGARTEIYAHADSALVAQRAVRDHAGVALTLFVQGYAAYALSDLATARRVLRESIREATVARLPFAEGWSHRFMGEVYWLANDATSADHEFQLASEQLSAVGDRFGLGSMFRIRAVIALDLGRVAEADSLFRIALAAARATNLAEGVYSARLGLAEVRAKRGDYAGALDELDAAERYGRTHGHAGWSAALAYRRGLFALRLGDLDRAERTLRALLTTPGVVAFDRYAAGSRLAELTVRLGQPDRALRELAAATDALDSLRASLDDRGLRLLVFQTRQYFDESDLGLATIVAGLVRAGRVPEALTLVERRRARELEDQLAAAHTFDDQTGSRLAVGSARPAILVSLPTDSATAVLEFVGAGQGQPTTAFVLTSRGVTGVILAPLDSLRGDVAGFARLVVAGGATGPIGTRLRRALFDPLAAVIPPGTHRLVLVSDDALHHLPWEALPLEGGDALGERFVVSHAPAAAIAATLRAGPSRAAPARVLAFGDPAFASATPAGPYHEAFDAVGGLPPLPGAATEAKMAARYGDGSISRIGPGASEAFLKRAQLADFAVLHFASHALVDERSLTSTALALAPGEGEDGFLTLSEIGTMRLAGSLVVLSACRTAAGVVVSGEGVQGLASALLAAGARAVLATRWLVEDASAAALMQDFYRELAGGRGVDEALLAAQGAARARGAGPREWAGFMVFGDGAMSIPLRPPRPRRWPVALLGAALLAGTAWLVRRRRMGGSEGAAQPSSYHRG